MSSISPIARKQRLLYPHEHPMAMRPLILSSNARAVNVQRVSGFGRFGLTGSESGAVKGASAGASAGSVIPVIGTAVGAILGAVGGAIAGSLNKKDPENYNFDQAVALWNQNRLSVLNIANKYLVLAGLFDLNIKTNIPIYRKYGHMGEERFTRDFANLIYNAAQSGQITASDTPQTIMVKVVQPWIDSWGFGPMSDPHADMINLILMGMIADYVSGSAPQAWKSRSGPLPGSFSQIPPFSLPSVQGPTIANPATQYAPTQSVAQAPVAAVQIAPPTASGQVASVASLPSANVPPGYLLVGNVNTLPVYLSPSNTFYTLSGSRLVPFTGTLPYQGSSIQITNGQAQPVTPTTVAVPAGYTLIGTANGLSAYQGLDGNYYSWNGQAMSPLTGTLTTSSGMSAQIVGGQPQQNVADTPSLSMASQQAYNSATAPYAPTYTPPASAPVAAPSPAPASSGLSKWLLPAALAGGAALFFLG